MTDNKAHHFVPQFLLRRFASDARLRQVCLFRVKDRRHIAGVSIRHQCARNYYYGRDPALEREFGRVEGDAAGVIKNIVERELAPAPGTHENIVFHAFLMLQWGRTPAAVARQESFDSQFLLNAAKSDPRFPKDQLAHIGKTPTKSANGSTQSMLFALRMGPTIMDLRLKILRNATNAEFALGDAPVVFHNQWCRRIHGVGSTGLANAGLLIFMPLSPRYLAVLYDTDVYRVGESSNDFVDVRDEDELLSYNALQFAAAHAGIYYRSSHLRDHFDSMPETARANPLGVEVSRFKEEGRDDSHMVILAHKSMNVDLKPGAIQIRDEVRAVARQERARRLRSEAEEVARMLAPRALRPDRSSGLRKDALFTRVDD